MIEKFPDMRQVRKPMLSQDSELASQYACARRFFFEGIYYCHKGFGQIRDIPTLLACMHCAKRLSEQAILETQQKIQKLEIHHRQLEINKLIGDQKRHLFPACHHIERETEVGREIRSSACKNDRLKNIFHPIEVCDLSCEYLKRLQMKKEIRKRTT